jgi:hypothetical protein
MERMKEFAEKYKHNERMEMKSLDKRFIATLVIKEQCRKTLSSK